MRIAVFGLGYVGVTTAACLSEAGHTVIGVDVSPDKVDLVANGRSPIVEEGVPQLVQKGVAARRLGATMDAGAALEGADMAIVCVGTPSRANGSLDTHFVEAVTAQIGDHLRDRQTSFAYVLRSTVLPGTVDGEVIPGLEQRAGRPVGDGYEVAFHPEFLREGSAVQDFLDPPKIVVGGRGSAIADLVLSLYEGIEAPRFATSIAVAEAVKYADNAFHALKIAFANEIGEFARAAGLDSREVMEIFCADVKLNISPKYLRPGSAFGGSCLPKDLRALTYAARKNDVVMPVIESVLPSNRAQIERIVRLVTEHGARRVGIVGLAFKAGTDDLRESPYVEIAERLVGKGVGVCVYDPHVNTSRLIGQNQAFIDRHLPHLSNLLVNRLDELCRCDAVIVGHPGANEALAGWLEAGKLVVDLVGDGPTPKAGHYFGAGW
jgi:GDP-mannose 6-dehydrogenase